MVSHIQIDVIAYLLRHDSCTVSILVHEKSDLFSLHPRLFVAVETGHGNRSIFASEVPLQPPVSISLMLGMPLVSSGNKSLEEFIEKSSRVPQTSILNSELEVEPVGLSSSGTRITPKIRRLEYEIDNISASSASRLLEQFPVAAGFAKWHQMSIMSAELSKQSPQEAMNDGCEHQDMEKMN
ncbi:hypothetical protein MJO29_000101 [Puccinia striiformis f. sp. tritici]|nr:hypothetical protein MJO29_000101 [Puccinia striiformis f. sp. tritici]